MAVSLSLKNLFGKCVPKKKSFFASLSLNKYGCKYVPEKSFWQSLSLNKCWLASVSPEKQNAQSVSLENFF